MPRINVNMWFWTQVSHSFIERSSLEAWSVFIWGPQWGVNVKLTHTHTHINFEHRSTLSHCIYCYEEHPLTHVCTCCTHNATVHEMLTCLCAESLFMAWSCSLLNADWPLLTGSPVQIYTIAINTKIKDIALDSSWLTVVIFCLFFLTDLWQTILSADSLCPSWSHLSRNDLWAWGVMKT